MTHDINGMRYLRQVREKSYTPRKQHGIWESPFVNRKYIFIHGGFFIAMLVSERIKSMQKWEPVHTTADGRKKAPDMYETL